MYFSIFVANLAFKVLMYMWKINWFSSQTHLQSGFVQPRVDFAQIQLHYLVNITLFISAFNHRFPMENLFVTAGRCRLKRHDNNETKLICKNNIALFASP